MNCLLDTHVYLWWLIDPMLLSHRARVAIANPKNIIFVSSVSFVEIAIKESLGKLKVDGKPEAELEKCRFQELPLTISHAVTMGSLPLIHKDPFDRMLVAQAQSEQMTLISRDDALAKYAIPILAA